MITAGLAVVEWLMLVVSITAQIFRQEPTHQNLTYWCNAQETLTDRMENT